MPKMTRTEARRLLVGSGRWQVYFARMDPRSMSILPHDTLFVFPTGECRRVRPDDRRLIRTLTANGGHVGPLSDFLLFHMEDVVD